jgi:hypothetical protein
MVLSELKSAAGYLQVWLRELPGAKAFLLPASM